jgi:hypothetical protein
MNKSATWWMADVWRCEVCGERCDEVDDDGNVIHERCKIDREAMRRDDQEDRRKGK